MQLRPSIPARPDERGFQPCEERRAGIASGAFERKRHLTARSASGLFPSPLPLHLPLFPSPSFLSDDMTMARHVCDMASHQDRSGCERLHIDDAVDILRQIGLNLGKLPMLVGQLVGEGELAAVAMGLIGRQPAISVG